MDIWDNDARSNADRRSSATGTSTVGGICSQNKYSITEYYGLNIIFDATHQLGHR